MFDEIECQYPLPDNPPDWVKNARFQTKNFDNLLDLYTITPEGDLIRHCIEREYIDDASAFLGYKVRIVREWQERVEFHGDIIFYTSNIKSSSGGQYELRADRVMYRLILSTKLDLPKVNSSGYGRFTNPSPNKLKQNRWDCQNRYSIDS
jgi:hypothetical protein